MQDFNRVDADVEKDQVAAMNTPRSAFTRAICSSCDILYRDA